MWRSAALLGLVAVLGTALLAVVHTMTRDRITAQERRVVLKQLHQVLPDSAYDNALHEDVLRITDEAFFQTQEPVTVYRARLGTEPVAVIMQVVAPDGYNGDIKLLVGVYADGSISGVRVVSHRETPGLGDPIEHQRSDWILDFNGRSLGNPEPAGWAVRRDGGVFDQFTGATITPRAVVEAVERALRYFEARHEYLFSYPEPEQT
ncbi:MAG: electron transport complex subunit RsxG [Xanthomonadales bacterium]|nr:electron transport complex subunit RsxG [Xanthomonadales bacterium]